MTTFNSYIYTKSAASRITERNVTKVIRKADHVLIDFEEGDRVSIDCSVFKTHFAEHRRRLGLKIDDVKSVNSYTYRVNQKYLVAVFPDRVSCTCNDYATQQKIGIKHGCCKHGYAVLKTLGYTSLTEFIEKQKVSPKPTKAKKETPALFPIKEKPAKDYSIVYKITFQTYASEEQNGYEVPLDTVERYIERKPTPKEINQYRKHAHERGYKLVSMMNRNVTPTTNFKG